MVRMLVVEDEPYFRKDMVRELSRYGKVFDAADLSLALRILNTQDIEIAFVDLILNKHASECEGIEIIKICHEKNIPSIVLTGHEEKSKIAEAYASGCHHYFSKLDFALNIHQIIGPLLRGLDHELDDFFQQSFITKNASLRSKITFIKDFSKTFEQNIMITGPSGVGKTKIAKLIHQFYNPKCPFVHVNLSELPENLIESELFGHKRGAFTGAVADKTGLLEKAHGGVLFFDEIGAIPLNVQKKLLKVIEEKKITPIGGGREKTVNFKLITATCDDLPEKINRGDFRVDFYFRIKGTEIEIPPLAKRKEDIFPLIDHIISKSPKKIAFDPEAQEALQNYHWPGNVRELENMVKELMAKPTGYITPGILPPYVVTNTGPFSLDAPETKELLLGAKMKAFLKKEGLPALIERVETEALRSTMEETGGGVNEPCRQLKISKSALYRIQKNAAGEMRAVVK